MNYQQFLESTRAIHNHVIYISLLENHKMAQVMLPAILGKDRLISIIGILAEAAANSIYPYDASVGDEDWESQYERSICQIQNIAAQWPEYVVGPNDLFTLFNSDIKASIFGV